MNILTETLAKNSLPAEQQIPALIYLITAVYGLGMGGFCGAAKTESQKPFLSLRPMRLISALMGIGLGTLLVAAGFLAQEPREIALGVVELGFFTAGYLGMQ